MPIDLRSDTVTKPTPAMREAMASALVGDDVYGEDPTVAELERRVAALLGHEAAVFTPSGSMANQLGVRLLVRPGQEMLCDEDAHVVRAELGATAAVSWVTTRTWQAQRGLIDPERVAVMMRPDAGPHLVSTAAVVVENTHNFGGGTVQPLETVRRLRDSHQRGGRTDAPRWRPAVECPRGNRDTTVVVRRTLRHRLGVPVQGPRRADRLGARVIGRAHRRGARLAQADGRRDAPGRHPRGGRAARTRPSRRRGWRDDHARARRLAETVADAVPGVVDPTSVETNIVVLVVPDASAVVARCREADVLVGALDRTHLRVLTHLDVDDKQVDEAAAVLRDALLTLLT